MNNKPKRTEYKGNVYGPNTKAAYHGWIEYCQDVVITSATEESTKDGTGRYLSVEFIKIINGEGLGRKWVSNFNLVSPDPFEVEIAQKELAELCNAAGVKKLQDGGQLVGRVLNIKVNGNAVKCFSPLMAPPYVEESTESDGPSGMPWG